MVLLEVIDLGLELFKFLNDVRLIGIGQGFDLIEIEDFSEKLIGLLTFASRIGIYKWTKAVSLELRCNEDQRDRVGGNIAVVAELKRLQALTA